MGLFGGGYSKPGPGVDKDAPKKKGPFLYMEILTRKFIKILQLNLIFSAVSIPWMILLYILGTVCTQGLVTWVASGVQVEGLDAAQVEGLFSAVVRVLFVTVAWLCIGSGPASAGYSYVTRNFTREEHAWVASDFFEKLRENIKYGVIVAVIDILVIFFGINAAAFYYSSYLGTGSMMWFAMFCLICIIMFVYAAAHFFIYQIMVSFECTFRSLIKNALLLALAKFPMCLLFLGLGAAILYLLFTYVNPVVVFVILIGGGYSLMRFPVEFYATRVIDKLFINNKKNEGPVIRYIEHDEEQDENE